MANYYVHLGFDWNSYKIGTVWGAATSDDYFLQYALTKNDQAPWEPALFRFRPGDDLSFRFWDLTHPAVNVDTVQLSAKVGFNSLRGAIYDRTNNPIVHVSGVDYFDWGEFTNNRTSAPKPCVQVFGGPGFDIPYKLIEAESPWGPARTCDFYRGPMGILNPGSALFPFKMSFFVGVSYDGQERRVFIADPETIIGSGRQ